MIRKFNLYYFKRQRVFSVLPQCKRTVQDQDKMVFSLSHSSKIHAVSLTSNKFIFFIIHLTSSLMGNSTNSFVAYLKLI